MVAPSGLHAVPWTRLQLGAVSVWAGMKEAGVSTFRRFPLEMPSISTRERNEKVLNRATRFMELSSEWFAQDDIGSTRSDREHQALFEQLSHDAIATTVGDVAIQIRQLDLTACVTNPAAIV